MLSDMDPVPLYCLAVGSYEPRQRIYTQRLTSRRSGVSDEQCAEKGIFALGSDGFPPAERANNSREDAPDSPTILDVERTESYKERIGASLRAESKRGPKAHPVVILPVPGPKRHSCDREKKMVSAKRGRDPTPPYAPSVRCVMQ